MLDNYIIFYSNGKIIDEVLKQRLENKVYTWFKEMNTMVALKPNVILEKDPAATPAQCTLIHALILLPTCYCFNCVLFIVIVFIQMHFCSDLDFWRNRERQFLEFYEQLDENIGLFLAATRSPCLGIYRQISETAEKGTHIILMITT